MEHKARQCVVINCTGDKKVKHRPKNEEQCKIWCSFPNIKWNGKSRSSLFICELHFSEIQYERDLKHELLGSKKKNKLKQDAVPDLLTQPLHEVKNKGRTVRFARVKLKKKIDPSG